MAGFEIMAALYIAGGIGYIIYCFWDMHKLEKRISKMEADPLIQELRAERKARERVKREHCPHHSTERYDSLYDHCLDCGEYFLYSYLPN